MRSNIPIELIEKHIRDSGWNTEITNNIFEHPKLTINQIISGVLIEDDNPLISFQKALEHIGDNRLLATLPEILETIVKTNNDPQLIQEKYNTHSEEIIGIDKKGNHTKKGGNILLVIHGGGLITPENILISEYLNNIVYSRKEFDNLLDGKLPDGQHIEIYNYEEIKKGLIPKQHSYGIAIDRELASHNLHCMNKKEFLKHPSSSMRAGSSKYLEDYYNLIKSDDGYIYFDTTNNKKNSLNTILNIYNNCYGIGYMDETDKSYFISVKPNVN